MQFNLAQSNQCWLISIQVYGVHFLEISLESNSKARRNDAYKEVGRDLETQMENKTVSKREAFQQSALLEDTG